MANRSEVQAEDRPEGAGEVFLGTVPHESALVFRFICREEAWLRAEGIIRKRRRRGGFEPVKDSKVSHFPKPEPVEVVPTREVPADRTEALSAVGSSPQSRSPTPPSYTDEDPAILEQPRKIPRRSGCFTCTGGGGMVSTGGNSLPSQVKLESDPVPKVKEEVGELKVNELKVCTT